MGESKHLHSHTVVGWASWIGVVIIIWAVAFILGNGALFPSPYCVHDEAHQADSDPFYG